jgi:hypothetical protein
VIDVAWFAAAMYARAVGKTLPTDDAAFDIGAEMTRAPEEWIGAWGRAFTDKRPATPFAEFGDVDAGVHRFQFGGQIAPFLDEFELVDRAGIDEFVLDRGEAGVDRLGRSLAAPRWLGRPQRVEIFAYEPPFGAPPLHCRFVIVAH